MSKRTSNDKTTKNKESKMQDNQAQADFTFPKTWTLFGPAGNRWGPEIRGCPKSSLHTNRLEIVWNYSHSAVRFSTRFWRT